MPERYFNLKPERRSVEFLEENIIAKLSSDKAKLIDLEEIVGLINDFEGQDMNALSVLVYAAEQDKLEEYIEKLKIHFTESLQYVHPQARRLMTMPGAVRAESFFVGCYKELGIQPRELELQP